MKTQIAYCSACDRDVRLAISDAPLFEGQANVPDPEVVCLEIGEKCTGALCPIGAQPPSVMRVRLMKSGLKPTVQPLLNAQCAACDQVTAFALVDPMYATCTICGTTVERANLPTPTSN